MGWLLRDLVDAWRPDSECHCFSDRIALTCSQAMTHAGLARAEQAECRFLFAACRSADHALSYRVLITPPFPLAADSPAYLANLVIYATIARPLHFSDKAFEFEPKFRKRGPSLTLTINGGNMSVLLASSVERPGAQGCKRTLAIAISILRGLTKPVSCPLPIWTRTPKSTAF
jgi:hypothetical protein